MIALVASLRAILVELEVVCMPVRGHHLSECIKACPACIANATSIDDLVLSRSRLCQEHAKLVATSKGQTLIADIHVANT